MQQHGSMVANILPADPHDPGDGVNRSKFNRLQNMVMLHMKLDGITNADRRSS